MRLKVLAVAAFGLVALAVISTSPLGPSSSSIIPMAAGATTPSLAASWREHWQKLAATGPRTRGERHKPTPSPSTSPDPAAAQAADCTLTVPANPLSAQGLATPWELSQTAGQPACHESDPNVGAFVQAVILDPATGQASVYDPLVIDQGSKPAIEPPVPTLPAGAVVGIWTGYNGNTLTPVGPGASACPTVFPQNAFCNTPAFWQEANALVQAGKLKPPPLGTGKDGRPCPTSLDFSIVDQDQSDNTTDQYLLDANGGLAQDTPANRQKMGTFTTVFNGSDERLVAVAVDNALGCTPWKAPDLADSTHTQTLPALPLNELQAKLEQAPPQALIPALDPFTLVNNRPNLQRLNAYRAGVGQPQVASLAGASTKTYCRNLLNVGLPRIAADRPFTSVAKSPFPDQASTLFNFLAMRFHNTFSSDPGFLHCTRLLHVHNPVTLTVTDGVVTDATIKLQPPDIETPANGTPAGDAKPVAVPADDVAASQDDDVEATDTSVPASKQ
jgi:hypothetical protein